MAAQQADPEQGRVVQSGDGALYAVKDGKKYQIQLADLSDEAIASTPDGGLVQQLDQLFATAPPPFSFTTRNGFRTEQQLKDELSSAGYGGPWDVSSMLVSYGQAGASTVPAPQAVAPPAAPSFIRVSDAWIEGGLRLIAKQPQGCGLDPMCYYAGVGHDSVDSYYTVENRTGSVLNTEIDKSVFSLSLSTGKQYHAKILDSGLTSVIIDNLADGASQDFHVIWDVKDDATWQADLRNSSVQYFEMGATEFTSRIHNAKWRQDVTH